MSELDRIKFVGDRDGERAAERFAEQTLAVYIADAIKQSTHRKSIEELQAFLVGAGYSIDYVWVRRADR